MQGGTIIIFNRRYFMPDDKYIEDMKKFQKRDRKIKRLLDNGVTKAEIARLLGISNSRVGQIAKRLYNE